MAEHEKLDLHVFLVAGEESGDRLGAPLMRALKERLQNRVCFSGIGGAQMAAQGLRSLFPLDDLAMVGLLARPDFIVRALWRIRNTAKAVLDAEPDILVIIDSPEFTHRVARRVRRSAPSIPIVDYVSPSVWAWRPGRARKMRAYVDHVLALLPFEPAAHARLGGPPCTYVGHPLTERIDALRPNADEQKRRDASPPIVLVMPGSRSGELNRMSAMFARATELLAARAGPLEVIVPAVPALARTLTEVVRSWRVPARVISDPDEKDAAFRGARLAIAKSGTGTLELALAGVPMVTAYAMSAPEAFIVRRLVSGPSAILANLVLGENVVPEFMQEAATPENLANAAFPLLGDTPARRAQLAAFKRLDAIMEIGSARPSERAATIVIEQARKSAS